MNELAACDQERLLAEQFCFGWKKVSREGLALGPFTAWKGANAFLETTFHFHIE